MIFHDNILACIYQLMVELHWTILNASEVISIILCVISAINILALLRIVNLLSWSYAIEVTVVKVIFLGGKVGESRTPPFYNPWENSGGDSTFQRG